MALTAAAMVHVIKTATCAPAGAKAIVSTAATTDLEQSASHM